ncbi:MAG: aminoacyl-tRNA hydrolase [Proteobacteria bacterium]|nr:aminoacyl-tRNA hydrolase [Pseudomonadota bacterium]
MIDEAEVAFRAVRASGPGGQHVNTTSSAVELRFDVASSTLPEAVKARLRRIAGQRLNLDDEIVLFAQEHRSQHLNKAAALERLNELVARAERIPKVRRPTKPTLGSKLRRLEGKANRGSIKAGRGRPKITD